MSDSDSVASSEAPKDDNNLANSDIITKYRLAGDIANRTLDGVIQQCVAGKSVADICNFGDQLITQQCAAAFKSKKIEKGIAFPTCVSVNELVCHFSPLSSESIDLKAGDIVRIDLGVHIDGYIGQVAHTIVVAGEAGAGAGAGTESKEDTATTGDVVIAAHTALRAAKALCKPGNTNTQVTAAIASVAESFGVQLVQGTLSHEVKRFVIDGSNVIIQKEDVENKVEEFTFAENQVFALDVCFSTGTGKPRDTGKRTTVFKRAVDETYRLKMKASRYVLNEVSKSFPTLPFTMRSLADEKQARMGVVECTKHDLLHAYPVLEEREGAAVAHFKSTVLLAPSGAVALSDKALDDGAFTSEKKPTDEIAALAASGAGKKKRRRRKKKPAAAAADA